MSCRAQFWVMSVVIVSFGLSGCTGDVLPTPAEPGASSGTDSTAVPDASEGTAPEETSDLDAPEGNTEPPLADVTSAVESLPPAEGPSAGVTLTVVSPEEFDAAVAKHKGKVVFVDFWATWCVPCRKAFPHTVELAAKHSDDLAVISMSFDDSELHEEALAFLKEQNATFDNLMCELGGGDESFDAYEIGDAGLPYFRLYDRSGALKQVFKNDVDAGKGVDLDEVHKAIEELLAAE